MKSNDQSLKTLSTPGFVFAPRDLSEEVGRELLFSACAAASLMHCSCCTGSVADEEDAGRAQEESLLAVVTYLAASGVQSTKDYLERIANDAVLGDVLKERAIGSDRIRLACSHYREAVKRCLVKVFTWLLGEARFDPQDGRACEQPGYDLSEEMWQWLLAKQRYWFDEAGKRVVQLLQAAQLVTQDFRPPHSLRGSSPTQGNRRPTDRDNRADSFPVDGTKSGLDAPDEHSLCLKLESL